MFRPAKIIKVRMFVTKKNYDVLMDILNDTAAMHVEPLSQMDREVIGSLESGEHYKELNELLQHFRTLESHLVPRTPGRKVSFKSTLALIASARKLKIWDSVSELVGGLNANNTAKKEVVDRIGVLKKLTQFGEDVSILSSDRVSSFILSKTDSDRKTKNNVFESLKASKKYTVFNIGETVVASVKKEQREEFATV